MSNPDSLRAALEEALLEAPDDLAAHSAYADLLIDQGDPRGEFIQLQLALEDTSRSAAERKRLEEREEALLNAHEREWLGELAPLLLATPEEEQALWAAERGWNGDPPEVAYGWVNGWLDHIECDYLSVELARKLGRAPIARLLRRLVWRLDFAADSFRYEDGPDIPRSEVGYFQPYEVLAHYPAVRNVRVFQFGREVDPEEDEYHAGTMFAHLAPLVEQMPRLEELYVFAYCNDHDMGRTEFRRLFSLPTLSNLRVLQYYHGHAYPLEELAANPALGQLTHLLCYPHKHARQDPRGGWATAISRASVRAVVRSPHLTALTHLQVRCSDGGDDMVEAIVESGVLDRLKWLDLRHGKVTDEGAKMLAACPGVMDLRLDLVNNRLTDRGVAALQRAGACLRAEDQQSRPYETSAFFCGDTE